MFIHAIGDRGIRTALDALQFAREQNGPRDSRHELIHIECLSPEDLPRFKALGVTACMQPRHCAPDITGKWAMNIGPERSRYAWAFRSLKEAGATLAFASDWNVAEMDPLVGIYTALTRQGLDGRPLVGGACVTEELIPGHRFSTASYVCSLMRPEIIEELALRDHGFEMLPCSSSFTVFPEGGALLLGLDAAEDARQIARYSKKDAEAYPRFNAALSRLADLLRPTLAMTPPDPAAPGLGDLLRLLKLGNRFRRMTRADQTLLFKMMTMSCAALLDEWFESSQLKATLAPTSTIGTYGSPRTPGTAFVLLHYYLGEANGSPGSWGFVKGGMGGLAEALASAARSRGAVIRVGQAVDRILIENGRARGVRLEGGAVIEGGVVVSNADPKRTFQRLVDPDLLPDEFRRGVETIRCTGNSAKINLALSELPDFVALPGDGPHLRGSIQICGSRESYLEEAFDDFKAGHP